MKSQRHALPLWPTRILRWLGHARLPGVYRLVWRVDRMVPIDKTFEVPFYGLRYSGQLDDWIDKHVYYFGAYSREELSFLKFSAEALRATRRSVNYFDVGANVGQHALFMHAHADRIFAFEPSQIARSQFEENIKRNNIEKISLFPVALGEFDTGGLLGSGIAGNRGSRSLLWTCEGSIGEPVVVVRGDRFLERENAPRIDILKLDVEGYEKKVLAGLAQRLITDRPVILMELMGESEKGGFVNERDLRASFYPDAELFALEGRATARLAPFNWDAGEIVVVPKELKSAFTPLIRL